MYEVGVITHVEAAHRLRGDLGPATRLHGHTYRVEVSVAGEELGADGTLLDLARLEAAVAEVTGPLHLACLDEVAGLAGSNTTAEVVAAHIGGEVGRRVAAPGLAAVTVRVWESPAAFASFRLALQGGRPDP